MKLYVHSLVDKLKHKEYYVLRYVIMELSSVMLLIGVIKQIYNSVCLNCTPELCIHPVCQRPN